MANGQTKIELLLELKNKIKAGLNSARDTLKKGVNQMKLKIKELRDSFSEVFDGIASEIPGLDAVIRALKSPIAAVIATVVLLGTAFYQSTQMASDWVNSMNKANVTAQISKKELGQLSDQLLEIGGQNTGNLMDVPETFNAIISAGFDVQTSLATLQPTLKAAKAGFTEAGIAADAATNIMGSTGILDATKVYDVLFATLNKGKAEFADIANYLPKIIPGARQVGVTFEQTAGAYAFLTATGLKAESASTALANAMKSLSDPKIVYGTKNMLGFKGVGVEIFDATGKIRDMVSIAKDLNKSMAGLTDEQRMKKFAAIGLDMESSMAFSKMSQGVDQLAESIDFTTNSAGEMETAFEAARHPLDSWKIMGNQVKVAMIELGQKVLPILGAIGEFLLRNKVILQAFGTIVLSVAATWGVYLLATNAVAIGLGIVTAAQWALNVAMTANPIGLIVTAVGALIGGLILVYQHSQKFRAILAGIMDVAMLLADIFIGLGKTIIGAFTFNPKMFAEGAKQTVSSVKEIMDGGIVKRFNAGYDGKIAKEKAEEIAKNKNKATAAIAPQGGLPDANKKGTGVVGTPVSGSKDAGKVTGSASQIKNLTINMDAMVKMGDFVSKNPEMATMNKRELEKWFTELCARMIRNLETSYS